MPWLVVSEIFCTFSIFNCNPVAVYSTESAYAELVLINSWKVPEVIYPCSDCSVNAFLRASVEDTILTILPLMSSELKFIAEESSEIYLSISVVDKLLNFLTQLSIDIPDSLDNCSI